MRAWDGVSTPDEYDPALKRWSLERLPFVPEKFELTFDVQVVDSAIAFRDTGVTAGLRLTKTF